MSQTRPCLETVLARLRRDPEFTAALYAEAISALLAGDRASTLSIFRDIVQAHISFKQLADQTGFGEKALHRMLGANGNPTTENLARIIHTVEKDLNLLSAVTARPSARRGTRVVRSPRRLAVA